MHFCLILCFVYEIITFYRFIGLNLNLSVYYHLYLEISSKAVLQVSENSSSIKTDVDYFSNRKNTFQLSFRSMSRDIAISLKRDSE